MKSMSCSLGRSGFGTLWIILLSFFVLSCSVQFSKLNQNVLVQAASMNQRGQSDTNRLNLPAREGADNPSFNRSIQQSAISNPPSVNSNPSNPQSAIQNLSSISFRDPKFEKSEVIQKTKKLQMPFIANNGQTNERVKFYANTFGGTVFVTEDREIVYSLPESKGQESGDGEQETIARGKQQEAEGKKSDVRGQKTEEIVCRLGETKRTQKPASEQQPPESPFANGDLRNNGFASLNPSYPDYSIPQSKMQHVALKEEFVGGKVSEVKGEKKSETRVNYFKGKDPSKWKTNISTYDVINLGEVYDGIELKLKAYGNNVEKLFCVKPEASPDQIKIKLSGIQPPESPLEKGARGLWVSEHGELVAETELGPVKFTKPIAYQEINGKRVDVSVEYRVESSEAENKSSKHKTCNSKLMSTNPKSKIENPKFEYGFAVASYDKTKDLIIDPLLASTFFGGSSYNYANVIAVDSSGDIYVAGNTSSSDFPTTTGAYDTTYNGSDSYGGDTFVSKLNGDLTSLIASTYLGGSSSDYANSIAVDKDGNIYVAGYTLSADFPTISSCYDTSYNGGGYGGDVFVSKLNGNLTSLLASTYLGGSNSDYSYSIAIDSNGNICMTGQTDSSDFPITTGTYDTSFDLSGYNDAFVSRLNSDLTTLLASTFLGGSSGEGGNSIAIDSIGNIYVTGWTSSSNFPTTTGAYDTSYNGNDYSLGDGYYYGHDIFVSKLNSDLTNLLASTYLGGSEQDYVNSIAIDSGGDIYVAGRTWSSNFPTTSGAYDTSYTYNGQTEAYVSKLNGDLTSLLASTYLGGNSYDEIHSIAINSEGNIYVTGGTYSSDFPTTTGAYDTSSQVDSSYGGDAFISKLNEGLTSLLSSTILGGSGGDDLGSSIAIDSSGNIYVAGYTYSIDFPATTGAYDTSYNGDENSHYDAFVSKLDSDLSAGGNIVPAPTPSPKPSYPVPVPTMPSPSPTPEVKVGKILGYVLNIKGNHVESVKLKLKGVNSKVLKKTVSDEEGLFEFADLDADTYTITALKKGYKTVKQTITLGAGEEKDIEIVMKKIRRK